MEIIAPATVEGHYNLWHNNVFKGHVTNNFFGTKEIRNYLNPIRVGIRFKDISVKDVSSWLDRNETFSSWSSCVPDTVGSALLTLKGKPGVGKSVLMKVAVEAAKTPQENKVPVTVLKYFFNNSPENPADDQEWRRTSNSLFASLLGQLLHSSLVSDKLLKDLKRWDQATDEQRKEDFFASSHLQEMIKSIILNNGDAAKPDPMRFCIFIDAVNECSDTGSQDSGLKTVLRFIRNLLDAALAARVDLRVCISRRHLPHIGQDEPPTREIDIDSHTTELVRDFLWRKLDIARGDNAETEYKMRMFHFRWFDQCGNGFGWASSAVESFLAVLNDGTLNSATWQAVFEQHQRGDVSSLSFHHTYRRILLDIDSAESGKAAEAVNLIQLVLAACRSLTTDELGHVLEYMDGVGKGNKTIKLSTEAMRKYLRHQSYGIIGTMVKETLSGEFFQEQELLDPKGPSHEQVQFIHSTVNSFLLGDQGLMSLRTGLARSEVDCHWTMFTHCTRALEDCEFEAVSVGEASFLNYAGEFWAYHAQAADGMFAPHGKPPAFFLRRCSAKKTSQVLKLLMHRLKVAAESGSSVLASAIKGGRLEEHGDDLLVVLAAFGCTGLLRQHLATCNGCRTACVEKKEKLYAAVSWALMGTWVSTAQYLIEEYFQEGDIDRAYAGKTLLYMACNYIRTKPEEIVKFLLDKGADSAALSPCMTYEYPLHLAIGTGGKMWLVELLLRQGDDKAHQLLRQRRDHEGDCKGWTALHTAVGNPRVACRVRRKKLQAILDAAPSSGLSDLLELRDCNGNTPGELAKMVCEAAGEDPSDLLDILDEFDNGRQPEKMAVAVVEGGKGGLWSGLLSYLPRGRG
ncbi:hypothetical protein M0657_007348 [Pyricularia oryzae]|nr:hypothetical protein M0657_007348 [Pyricularia oryzae]KAI7930575.1 hypothetical protein M9X92_000639 [Pyricularia oryzae]